MPIGVLDELANFVRLTASPRGWLWAKASMSFGCDGTCDALHSSARQPSANVKGFVKFRVQQSGRTRYWNRDLPL